MSLGESCPKCRKFILGGSPEHLRCTACGFDGDPRTGFDMADLNRRIAEGGRILEEQKQTRRKKWREYIGAAVILTVLVALVVLLLWLVPGADKWLESGGVIAVLVFTLVIPAVLWCIAMVRKLTSYRECPRCGGRNTWVKGTNELWYDHLGAHPGRHITIRYCRDCKEETRVNHWLFP